MKRFVTLLSVVLALSLAAFAQMTPVQQTMSDFGLVGRWSTDCSTHTPDVFSYINGVVYDVKDLGQGKVRSYIHTEARLLDPTHLSVTVTISDNFAEGLHGVVSALVYFKHPDGRMQTISNIRNDGTVVVQDGVVLKDGDHTPSWGRCQ